MNSDYSRCWANCRSDCDRNLSKEHLISKSLFPEKIIYVSGFDWCQSEEKYIGINALQRSFLCGKHNNDLSPTDQAAKCAITAFETGASIHPLNGVLLERWLVKTAINLSIDTNLHIGYGMNQSKKGWPSPYLVAVAFGSETLCAKMGAYFMLPMTQYKYRAREIMVVPIHRDEQIAGFIFNLRGQYIFLNLFPGHAPPIINTLVQGLLPEPISTAPLCYRPTSFGIQDADGKEGRIELEWIFNNGL